MIEVDCPRCGASVLVPVTTILGRGELACPACGQGTPLDQAKLEAAELAAAKRAFRSTGPRPTAVRRYRVEVAPIAELPPDSAADDRRPPFVANAPALGREPFAFGDTAEEAVAALTRVLKLRADAGRFQGALPPSDADPTGRWVEVSD